MQQQDEPFPLAAALGFDAPAAHQPADGQPADEQPAAPMAWVELFCTVHADPAIFTGILRTCRGGRDWALSRVSRLSLIFRAADCKSAKVFQARVRAAKRAIQARREEQLAAWRPVGLRINCDYGSLHPMLRTLPDALRDQGGAVFELRLEKIDDPRAVTNFLQQAVAVFKIGSLWLEACDCRIPTPAQLPRLEYIRARHVQLTGPLDLPDDSDSDSNSNPDSAENYGDMIGQIAALMPQLKGIDLDSNQELPWALLFANPTPRLEQVTYTLPLNNQAMKLLLDNAPNLKHLFLHSLWVTSDEFKDRLWQVDSITLFNLAPISLRALALLPRREYGRFELRILDSFFINPEPNYADSLAQCIFTARHILIPAKDPFRAANERYMAASSGNTHTTHTPPKDPPSLSAFLPTLASMQAPHAVLELSGWDWYITENWQAVCEAVRSFPHLRFMVKLEGALSGGQLSGLVGLGAARRRLCVRSTGVGAGKGKSSK